MTQSAPALAPYDQDLVNAAVDRLDATAHAMERKWGIGRLRLLVDDQLRAKFDRQARAVDEALNGPTRDGRTIIAQVDAMERGWQLLDKAANAAGYMSMPPTWGEAVGPTGKLFLIVGDNADASQIAEQAAGREATVFTFAEVGRLLTAWPVVATAKAEFPGARVTELRVQRPIDWARGDDLPF